LIASTSSSPFLTSTFSESFPSGSPLFFFFYSLLWFERFSSIFFLLEKGFSPPPLFILCSVPGGPTRRPFQFLFLPPPPRAPKGELTTPSQIARLADPPSGTLVRPSDLGLLCRRLPRRARGLFSLSGCLGSSFHVLAFVCRFLIGVRGRLPGRALPHPVIFVSRAGLFHIWFLGPPFALLRDGFPPVCPRASPCLDPGCWRSSSPSSCSVFFFKGGEVPFT